MKRVLFLAVLLVISNYLSAQKDITKFMGIPIDGFKPEMIQKLKEKGFTSSAYGKDILEGEFNGTQVILFVVTNNNKVCRIALRDAHGMNGTNIKIRFNKLCQQFEKNPNYVSFDDFTIADEEDISFEQIVNNKRYEAAFYQKPLSIDSTEIENKLKEYLLKKYTEQELGNPTEEMEKDIYKMSVNYATEIISKKPVWFMISNSGGEYYISMYYDNEYNKANGEDL